MIIDDKMAWNSALYFSKLALGFGSGRKSINLPNPTDPMVISMAEILILFEW